MTQELIPVQQATEQGGNTPDHAKAFAAIDTTTSLLVHPTLAHLVKGHVHATTCYYNRQSAQKSDRKSPEFNLLLL